MAEISTDEIFSDVAPDNALNGARLNNAFDSAIILPTLITDKGAITPATGDYVLFYDISGTILGKATWASLFTTLGDASTATASPRSLGTGSTQAAPGNDTRFPASLTGVRMGNGNGSADTIAKPPQHALAPTAGTVSTGASPDTCSLDCSLNNRFTVLMLGDVNGVAITLANFVDGDTVLVQTTQDGTTFDKNITFAATGLTIKWLGGNVQPTKSSAASAVDVWRFQRFGSFVRADAVLNFT